MSVNAGQSDNDALTRFETPGALLAVYIDSNPSVRSAEDKLVQLRAENPGKSLIRVALYQSPEDAREAERPSGVGHTTLDRWKTESDYRRSLAAPMAEAVKVNGYGIARSYRAGTMEVETPAGLLSLAEIACGQSTMRYLAAIGGRMGPDRINYVQLYFQWTNTTTQADAECLAGKIGLASLPPVWLFISSNPLFHFDTNYPRFNRFIEPAYREDDRRYGDPQLTGPNYGCTSFVRGQGVSCVTLKVTQ